LSPKVVNLILLDMLPFASAGRVPSWAEVATYLPISIVFTCYPMGMGNKKWAGYEEGNNWVINLWMWVREEAGIPKVCPTASWPGKAVSSQVALANGTLSGIIPSALGNLTRLGYINFVMNYLTGLVPCDLFRLCLVREKVWVLIL
jgi:hypothetical protein